MKNTKNRNEQRKEISHNLTYATFPPRRIDLNLVKNHNHEFHE